MFKILSSIWLQFVKKKFACPQDLKKVLEDNQYFLTSWILWKYIRKSKLVLIPEKDTYNEPFRENSKQCTLWVTCGYNGLSILYFNGDELCTNHFAWISWQNFHITSSFLRLSIMSMGLCYYVSHIGTNISTPNVFSKWLMTRLCNKVDPEGSVGFVQV